MEQGFEPWQDNIFYCSSKMLQIIKLAYWLLTDKYRTLGEITEIEI